MRVNNKLLWAVGLTCAAGLFSMNAYAESGFCDSKWLKKDTHLIGTLSQSKGQGNFDLQVLSVNRQSANQCEAKFTLGVKASQGKLPISGKGVLSMKVNGDHAEINGSLRTPSFMNGQLQSQVNLSTNGYLLFKPQNIVSASGQLKPLEASGNVSGNLVLQNGLPIGQLQVSNASFKAATRNVSAAKRVSTGLGKLNCQQITYQGIGSTGQLSIPNLNLQKKARAKNVLVVETYCSEPGLSPKLVINPGSKHELTLEINKISVTN